MRTAIQTPSLDRPALRQSPRPRACNQMQRHATSQRNHSTRARPSSPPKRAGAEQTHPPTPTNPRRGKAPVAQATKRRPGFTRPPRPAAHANQIHPARQTLPNHATSRAGAKRTHPNAPTPYNYNQPPSSQNYPN